MALLFWHDEVRMGANLVGHWISSPENDLAQFFNLLHAAVSDRQVCSQFI
jgi:hypothetical protein